MKYYLRKLVTLIITLFVVSLLAFLAFQIVPGDAAARILGTEATPEPCAIRWGWTDPCWCSMGIG